VSYQSQLTVLYKIINEYSNLLEQIGQLQCQASTIDSLGTDILNDSTIPAHEKDLLLRFLSHLYKINDELQTHYWMSEHLKVLHEMGQAFSKTFKREEIYQKAFELVSRVMDTNSFFIALFEEEQQKIFFPFIIEEGTLYQPFRIDFGQGIVSQVIKNRETVHIKTNKEFELAGSLSFGDGIDTNTAIYVPLLIGDHVKGVISAQSYQQFAYKKEHEELLKIIGSQVIHAIENSILYETVYELSIRDELTNLFNRRAFHTDLEKQIAWADRHNASITLIMFDSDDLKKVNDLYGHHMGDIYLKHISHALTKHLRSGETAYRYAGDEFMVLAPNLSEDEAWERVHLIQNYLNENPIEIMGNKFSISVSIGIASYPQHASSAEELKRMADKALYFTKNKGKNQVTIYNKSV